jgi:hypothetical protein
MYIAKEGGKERRGKRGNERKEKELSMPDLSLI